MNERRRQKFDLANRPLMVEPYRLSALMASSESNGVWPLLYEDDKIEGSSYKEERQSYRMDGGVAIFDVEGALYNADFTFIANNGYKSLEKNFQAALDDSAVEAILFNFNSPGGEAGGMFDLSDAVYRARGIKPVWSIANDDLFSAAYGLASSTDRIYVTRTGGVGSVGVVAVHVEISKAADQAGMTFTVFRAGKYKAEQNLVEPLTAHARDSIQEEMDRLYGMFVDLVSRNRGLSGEKIRATEAGLYFGEKGIEIGFADRLGTYDRAVADLKQFISGKKGTFTMSTPTTNPTGARAENAAAGNEESRQTPIASQTPSEAGASPVPAGEISPLPKTDAVSAADVRREAMEVARAETRQIAELCAIAGKPELACGFIEKQTSVENVRKRLIDLRAEEADQNPINGHHQPTTNSEGKARIDMQEIYANYNSHLRK